MQTALERLQKRRREEAAQQTRRELEAVPAIIADLPEPPEWHQAVSDVLGLLAVSEVPMTHSAILAAMIEKGCPRQEARSAIAYAQERGWIGHNLTTGYELL